VVDLTPTWRQLSALMIRPFANRRDFNGKSRKAEAENIRTVGRHLDTIASKGFTPAATFAGSGLMEAEAMIVRLEKRPDIEAEHTKLVEWCDVLDLYIAEQRSGVPK